MKGKVIFNLGGKKERARERSSKGILRNTLI